MTWLGFDLYDDEARFRTETLQQQFPEELLRVGCTVVYESGGWTRVERDALRERARATGAAVELRFLDVPLDLLWKRVSHRNHDLPSVTAIVEREDLVRWWSEFQRPKADEQAQYDPAR